jgi:hypothetical protein
VPNASKTGPETFISCPLAALLVGETCSRTITDDRRQRTEDRLGQPKTDEEIIAYQKLVEYLNIQKIRHSIPLSKRGQRTRSKGLGTSLLGKAQFGLLVIRLTVKGSRD